MANDGKILIEAREVALLRIENNRLRQYIADKTHESWVSKAENNDKEGIAFVAGCAVSCVVLGASVLIGSLFKGKRK